MSDYCVVLVNGARARFFTLEPADKHSTEGGPNLKEQWDLVNPEEELHGDELWSDMKSGRNRVSGSGQAHGYDDHRSGHSDESRRRFARGIAREAVRLIQDNGSKNVILASQKRMLGFLRSELDPLAKTGVALQAITKDLSKLSPQQVHEHLARENLVPPRRFPAA